MTAVTSLRAGSQSARLTYATSDSNYREPNEWEAPFSMLSRSGSKVRSSRRAQPVANRRAPSRFVVAGLAALLLGASVASAAATVQYEGSAGHGPVQFAVTGSHIQLTLLQTTIGRCNWMVYSNSRIAGRIKHRAFRLSKTFSNKSMLKITGKVLSPSKLKGTIRGVVPGQCDATVSFTATQP